MPRPRLAMRKIRDILRLALGEGLSRRQVGARSASLHHGRRPPAPGERGRALLAAARGPRRRRPRGAAVPEGPAPAKVRPLPDFTLSTASCGAGGDPQAVVARVPRAPPRRLWLQPVLPPLPPFQRHLDVVMRQEHRAGEKFFVDFPGLRIPIYDRAKPGVIDHAELFVAVLGASSYLYAEALPSQELLHWIAAHVHAFEFLGAVPSWWSPTTCARASPKPTATSPTSTPPTRRWPPTTASPSSPPGPTSRGTRPRSKPGVLFAERWILARLRNQRFSSLAEANAAIAACVTEINARPFKKMDGSRRELFEELDRPALRPLPAERYEFATWKGQRSTSTTTSSSTATTTRCPTSWSARRSTPG